MRLFIAPQEFMDLSQLSVKAEKILKSKFKKIKDKICLSYPTLEKRDLMYYASKQFKGIKPIYAKKPKSNQKTFEKKN